MSVSDIVVAPCKILRAPLGTTLPADSLAFGGTWPVGWTSFSLTKTPLSVNFVQDLLKLDVQESLGPVGGRVTAESLEIETTAAELNLDWLANAWGGTATTTPAGAGQVGKQELNGGDVTLVPEYMWGFEGETPAGRPIRFIVYKGTAQAGAKLEFGKKDYTGIPMKITAFEDLSKAKGQRLYKMTIVTAAATS